jgi:hypothetical protein
MIFSRFHTLGGHEILWTVPNSPRNKNLKKHISYLLEKVIFLDPKRLLSPFGIRLSRGRTRMDGWTDGRGRWLLGRSF